MPRQRPDGHWEPSTNAGANVRRGGGVSGVWWYCNKQYFQAVELDDGPPIGSSLYKTYSVYYSDGCGIWVMDADATTLTNGDWHSWHTLTFDHYDDYSSYLTNAGEHHTLCIQRSGQRWPTLLLPDIYHTGRRITSASQYGGLIGELPILLGLIALSTPRAWLPNVLPTMFMGGKWQIHQYSQPRKLACFWLPHSH